MEVDFKTKIQAQVITLFENIYPLNEAAKDQISSFSEVIKVKKKEQLLHIGDTSKYIYFIYQGAIRTYHLDSAGSETTSWLLFENEIVISVYGFFSQKPSFEAIEALEDSVLLRLNREKLNQLYIDVPSFNYIGRILTEQYYIRSEEKANALRMLSAKDRYLRLIIQYPQIIQRVSLGHIASYLGITQHTLSRIRAQL